MRLRLSRLRWLLWAVGWSAEVGGRGARRPTEAQLTLRCLPSFPLFRVELNGQILPTFFDENRSSANHYILCSGLFLGGPLPRLDRNANCVNAFDTSGHLVKARHALFHARKAAP
jgi:hypothetical protein